MVRCVRRGGPLWSAPLLAALALVAPSAAAQTLPAQFFRHADGRWEGRGAAWSAVITSSAIEIRAGAALLLTQYEGASPSARIEACGLPGSSVNLLLGNNPAAWETHLAASDCLRVRGLYPGIDLRLASHAGRLKSEYELSSGADVASIRLRHDGATSRRIEPDGSLALETAAGVWREDAPTARQAGGEVEVHFHLSADGTAGFDLGAYDRRQPLVIDPVVDFSTLIGSDGISCATAVATDAAGYVYVAGYSDTAGLVVQSPVKPVSSGVNAYLAKIQTSTGKLIYATYLGGTGDDRAFALAVDSAGTAYVGGWTTSTDFPVSSAAQNVISGSRDAFLLHLSADGGVILFSTYFGGAGTESANAITLAGPNVWIGGNTSSSTLPSAASAFSSAKGDQDGFVACYSTAGALAVSAILGGSKDDSVRAITADGSGNLFVGGGTLSADWAFPSGGLQAAFAGGQDAYVLKLAADAGSLLAGTYLGGSATASEGAEAVNGLAIDSSGTVYAVGSTPSADFPISSGLVTVQAGNVDAFAVSLSPTLSVMNWGSFLGGYGKDMANAVTFAPDGGLVVGGSTTSANFLTLNAVQASNAGGSDAFLTKLSPDGTSLLFSTYLGGASTDGVFGVASTPSGELVAAGQTGSADFPQKNAVQSVTATMLHMFVTRVTLTDAGALSLGNAVAVSGPGIATTVTWSASHTAGASSILRTELQIGAAPDSLPSCRVRYVPSTSTLYLASDDAVVWTAVPPGSSQTAANSSCKLYGLASTANASGNTVTVSAAVSFLGSFSGLKHLFSSMISMSSETLGPDVTGSLTAAITTNAAPVAASVSPASSSAASVNYVLTITDANGATDIAQSHLLVNAGPTEVSGCSVLYDHLAAAFYLRNDAGTAWLGPVAPGAAATLSNTQCRLAAAASGASLSGATASVTFALTLLAGGTKAVYGAATDLSGASSSWTALGVWASDSVTFSAASVTSGPGASSTIAYSATHSLAASQIDHLDMLVGTSSSATTACQVRFRPAVAALYLADDTGANWMMVRPASRDVASNSQCTLYGSATSISMIGVTAYVSANLAFSSSFAGAKSVYLSAVTVSAASFGPAAAASLTVTASTNYRPISTFVSPASGGGSTQTFTFSFRDANGGSDVSRTRIMFQHGIVNANACSVLYDHAANSVYLLNDAGTGWLGPSAPGSSGSLANSQCSLALASTTSSYSGATRTVVLPLTFASAFTGIRTIYVAAADVAGSGTNWIPLGRWTPYSAANSAPTPLTVTPQSGSGPEAVLRFTVGDNEWASDISSVRVRINSTASDSGGCTVRLDASSNLIYLYNDAGSSWLGPVTAGSSATLSNSQCTVRASGTLASAVWDTYVYSLNVIFSSSFTGAKYVWAMAADASSASSAYVQLGVWTASATAVNMAPFATTVSPSSASGVSQSFVFYFVDANGATDISSAQILINAADYTSQACYLKLSRSDGMLYLSDDLGTGWTAVTPGSSSGAANSQCVLYGSSSALTSYGNVVKATLNLGFLSPFYGVKRIWASVTDTSGATGAQNLLGYFTAQ